MVEVFLSGIFVVLVVHAICSHVTWVLKFVNYFVMFMGGLHLYGEWKHELHWLF